MIKGIIIICICAIPITLIANSIYKSKEHRDEIHISSRYQFVTVDNSEVGNKDDLFIEIESINKVLKCNKKDFDLLNSMPLPIKKKNITYKLIYTWNDFNKDEGKIIQIIQQ